jgi:hypothetical protein
MKVQTAVPAAKVSSSTSPVSVLRRKCSCGGNASALTGQCGECSGKKLQKKLAVGSSTDASELEADRMADHVMSRRTPGEVESAPLRVQRLSDGPATAGEAAPPSVDRALSAAGAPLQPDVRHDLEQRFGHDFSRVRVHTGAAADRSARDVGAFAYTVGQDIVFGAGQYAPRTSSGRRLLAHELAHTLQTRAVTGAPSAGHVVRRRGRAGASKSKGPLERSEAVRLVLDAWVQGLDDSMLGMKVIREELSRPFTLENAESRSSRLLAAFTLLDAEAASALQAALTAPKTAEQERLRERFGRLSRGLREDLLAIMTARAPKDVKPAGEPAQPQTPTSASGTAVWIPIAQGYWAHLVDQDGMTVDRFARTVTGHPDLPQLIAQLSDVSRTQRLARGQPLLVPIEYVDYQSPAFANMPEPTQRSIFEANRVRFQNQQSQRFVQARSGHPIGPGGFGLIPVTLLTAQTLAGVLGKAGAALFAALKRAGGFIIDVALMPYRAAKSILAFIEGLVEGVRDNVDADTMRKIVDKKPSKLDLVLFVPAYTAGVVVGVVDEGIEILKGLKDIITDPIGFLKTLAKLFSAFLTEDGEAIFRPLGQATGKEFAGAIKGLAGESMSSFAYGIGKIAALVVVEVIMTMIGAKAAKFGLEAMAKLRKVKKFEALASTLSRKFLKRDLPDIDVQDAAAAHLDDAAKPKPSTASDAPHKVPSKLTPDDLKRLKGAANEFGISPDTLKNEVDDLIGQAANPDNVRQPPAGSHYDAEMKAKDGHKFERDPVDNTWCRSTKKECGGDLGDTANAEVDGALVKKGKKREGTKRVSQYERDLDQRVGKQKGRIELIAERALARKLEELLPDDTRVTFVKTERSAPGRAQGRAAARPGTIVNPDFDWQIDLPDPVRKQAGLKPRDPRKPQAGTVKPDDVEFLGGDKYRFKDHKEVDGPWETAYYNSDRGRAELRAQLQENVDVAKALGPNFKGTAYTTNSPELANWLAKEIAKFPPELRKFLAPPR